MTVPAYLCASDGIPYSDEYLRKHGPSDEFLRTHYGPDFLLPPSTLHQRMYNVTHNADGTTTTVLLKADGTPASDEARALDAPWLAALGPSPFAFAAEPPVLRGGASEPAPWMGLAAFGTSRYFARSQPASAPAPTLAPMPRIILVETPESCGVDYVMQCLAHTSEVDAADVPMSLRLAYPSHAPDPGDWQLVDEDKTDEQVSPLRRLLGPMMRRMAYKTVLYMDYGETACMRQAAAEAYTCGSQVERRFLHDGDRVA